MGNRTGQLKENDKNPFAMFKELIETIQERAPEGFVELSKYGWYLGYDGLPRTPIELGYKLRMGHENEVNKFLEEYYEEQLGNIENRLFSRNPKRKGILKEGFDNHRKGDYFSSITLLLTQADGLCYDKAKKFYFQNNNRLKRDKIYKPAIEEEIIEESFMFLKEYLAPMNHTAPINESMDNMENFPVRFNRHEIIHGVDLEYGTKINSLKTISFLNYLNDVLHLSNGVTSNELPNK